MNVLMTEGGLEFYADRRWLHEFDPARESFVVTDDRTRIHGDLLVARMDPDGTCYDGHGRRIDSLLFLRAYQAASIIRRLDAGCADPERIYYAIEPNERDIRAAITEQLLAAVSKKSLRDRLVSMLFWYSEYGGARVYIDSAIEDAFEELGLPVEAHYIPKTRRDAEVCILGLSHKPPLQV